MTNKNVIGLGGLLRSGKDTVADYLVEKHGYTKMGMSDPLLEMALVLNPRIRVPFQGDMKYGRSTPEPTYPTLQEIVEDDGYTEAKKIPEVRSFLQRLGTDVGRNMIDQDLWTKQASKSIDRILEQGGKVALTGIRFYNELDIALDYDGENVWVERPSVRQDTEHSKHASEATLSSEDFDRVLLNHGTLEDLYWVVDKWVKS